jgi:hypothetical protein
MHTFKISVTTIDGVYNAVLEIKFEVVSVGYEPYKYVKTNLIAEFDATGKLNNSSNQSTWEDSSGQNVACNLYNFNYSSNGWIDNTLVLSGKSYAELNMTPFIQGVKNGFSLDILFKVKCVGNIDAKVISCKNPFTPYQGLEINTWKASMITKDSETASIQIQDDTWTKITYVVDRTNRLMSIYINGVISSATYLLPNDLSLETYTDEFTYDGKILLGGSRSTSGEVENNSVSEIKNLRIYDRALTDTEVLQNYIADITDEDEQMAVRNLNTTTEGMPTMAFVGNFDMMDENSERIAQISYNDPSSPSKTFVKDGCLISWQGTSSKNYPVKNYTIKLKDGGNPSLNFAPKDEWKPETRWTLKANYMDSSNANNIGLNKFIYDFFKPYPYPSQVTDPSTRANIDGFPIRLTINGEEIGIYTWNIDRYAYNNYGFVTYNDDYTVNRSSSIVSYEVGVNSTTGAGAFMDDSWDSIRSEFECRYNYRGEEDTVTETLSINGTTATVLKTGMHNELQALVTWVKNSTNDQFYGELTQHFSKRHLIDYYLIAYIFGMIDNLGKNMVLTTWGKDSLGNTVWYPSFYDCDSTLGINNSGIIAFDAGLDMADGDYNTSNSLLWTKLTTMFSKEIQERYKELRMPRTIDGVAAPAIFSYENIISYIGNEVIDTIGQKFYNTDARNKYLNAAGLQWLYLCNGTRKDFTERWLKERFVYMDSVYEFNYDTKAVIRSYAQGNLKLSLKTYSPQWILISFSDAASTKLKKYVSKEYYVDFEMLVNNGTDNNIEIYGCDNIMYIDGINGLDVRQLNIANATKLTELDISYNTRIEEIELGNNTYLTKLICNNCTNLGYQVDNRTLNLANCTTLRELNCSNTHIANVILSSVGGVIEALNCSNTDITSFTLIGQEYLTGLSLDGCLNLTELTVNNCDGLQSVTMVDTQLSKISITSCDNLDSLDISFTKALKIFDLSGCPNLKTLVMQGVSNAAITDLDLTYQLKLENLDISSCTYITNLTFGQYTENGVLKNYSALKTFKCDNSAIKSIRFGKNTAIPTYLDLAGLNLTDISFNSCVNVTDIRNINLVGTDSSPFNNCYNLVSITGNVKLIGSTTRAFYNCQKLVTLPTLDLSGMASTSETFALCPSLTMDHVTQILVNSKITGNFTTQWRMFYQCTGIVGTLSSNLFSLCTKLITISEIFNFCSGITGSIPVNLLSPMTLLQSCTYAFSNTSINGEVPQDLLRYNTEITVLDRMFNCTKITYVYLDDIFKYNTKLTSVYGTFASCANLQLSLTDNMFKYNRQLTSAGQLFCNCPGVVGNIPRNLFNIIPTTDGVGGAKLENIESFFTGTNISGTIPAYVSDTDKGLLDNLPLLKRAGSLFYGCTNLTGSIPTDFFKYNNALNTCNYVFSGCSGLSGVIPPNLLKGKTQVNTVGGMFKNCSGLISTIPIGFLDDCTLITDVSELFFGCSGLYGTIPERISTIQQQPSKIDPTIMEDVEVVSQYGLLDKCPNLLSTAYLFYGCAGLVSEIPPKLLLNGTKITSINSMFSRCYYLYGSIPAELLANCRSLLTAKEAFRDCVGLYNAVIDEDNPYAIPSALFKGCYSLTDVSYMFYMMDTGLPNASKLNGAIPPDLFQNNTKLNTIAQFLSSCVNITGELNSNLFQVNTKLTTATYAFYGTGITSLGTNLFSTCTLLKNLAYTFMNCTSLTGPAPEYWSETNPVKATTFTACFRNDTGLSNYSSILASWK